MTGLNSDCKMSSGQVTFPDCEIFVGKVAVSGGKE